MTLGGQAVARQEVFRGTSRYWMTPLCLLIGAAAAFAAKGHFEDAVSWLRVPFFDPARIEILKGSGWAVAGLIVVWWVLGPGSAACVRAVAE